MKKETFSRFGTFGIKFHFSCDCVSAEKKSKTLLDLVNTVKKSFQKILPENAHEIASGRLHISLTRVSDFKNIIVSEYTSKEDLIEVRKHLVLL